MTDLHLTPEQEAEAQVVFQRLKVAFEREALQLARLMASKEDRQLLGRTEFEVRDHVHRLGAQVVESVLQERKKKGYQGTSTACPVCAEPARCVGYRGKTIVSLLGAVRLARPYYHCASCGQGVCPWDAVLGVTATALSPGVEEVACIAGVQGSFAEASAKVLPKLAGLQLAESTVERTTEAAGQRLAAAQTVGQRLEKSPGRSGRGTGMRRGRRWRMWRWMPPGSRNKGAREQKWRVAWPMWRGCTIRCRRTGHAGRVRRWGRSQRGKPGMWLAWSGWRWWARPSRQQGVAVGIDRAERWIALSDGGNGLEDCVRTHFPRVEVVILDFYHAAEYLSDLAIAWHGADANAGEALGQQWGHQLNMEGARRCWRRYTGLDLRGRSTTARECYQATVRYFTYHLPRMDYPTYCAEGWQIG